MGNVLLFFFIPGKKRGVNTKESDWLAFRRSQIETSSTLRRTSKRNEIVDGSDKFVLFEMQLYESHEGIPSLTLKPEKRV